LIDRVVVTLDVICVVSAFVEAVGALDDVSRPDARLAARQVGEEHLFRLTLLASETEIPLSGS
jgi:hypothetical protein